MFDRSLERAGLRGAGTAGTFCPAPGPEDAVLAAEAHAELAAEVNLDARGEASEPSSWRAFHAWAVLGVPVEMIAEAGRAPNVAIYNRIRLAREDLRASIRRERAARRR